MTRRWLFDFDSTLTRFCEAQADACNARFGTAYAAGDVATWGWWWEQPKDRAAYVWGDLFESREWTLTVPPQPHAVAVVHRLLAAGDTGLIVSDRQPHMREWLVAWRRRYGLPRLPVVVSHREHWPKREVALDFGLTHAVEDAPHHAVALADAGLTVYLLNAPYNRNVAHPGVRRVAGWREIAQEVLGG